MPRKPMFPTLDAHVTLCLRRRVAVAVTTACLVAGTGHAAELFVGDYLVGVIEDDRGVVGAVRRVDPNKGDQTTIALDQGLIPDVWGIAMNDEGLIYVASGLGIAIVDPERGQQSSLTSLPGAFDVEVDGDGTLWVSTIDSFRGAENAIIKVDPQTGKSELVASSRESRLIGRPLGIALDAAGKILVANALGKSVTELDPQTGDTILISGSDNFQQPRDLVVMPDDTIYVADFFAGSIFRIDRTTGDQQIVSSQGFLNGPARIKIEDDNHVVVTAVGATPHTGKGEDLVVRVNLGNGNQELVTSGGPANFHGLEIAPVMVSFTTTMPQPTTTLTTTTMETSLCVDTCPASGCQMTASDALAVLMCAVGNCPTTCAPAQ